jgi:hypothetical protein
MASSIQPNDFFLARGYNVCNLVNSNLITVESIYPDYILRLLLHIYILVVIMSVIMIITIIIKIIIIKLIFVRIIIIVFIMLPLWYIIPSNALYFLHV